MRQLTYLALLLLALQSCLAHPQTSGKDILDAAGSANRYGSNGNSGIDDDLVGEIFGAPSDDKSDEEEPYTEEETEDVDDGPYEGDDNEDLEDNSVVDPAYVPPKVIVDTSSHNCTHYEEDGFYCVPYYQCEEGEIVVDGGPGIIDIRQFDLETTELELDPSQSKCVGYLESCCRHPDFLGEPIFTKPPEPPKKPYVSRCGRHNENGIGVRIQNIGADSSTQFGEWPHMCAVLEESGDKNLYVCGASLIDDDLVMTAAHCVDKLRDAKLKVRCGEWDTQQEVEPVEHQDRSVQYKLINPLFAPRNLSNNVAILKVETPFELSAHIDTICLPEYQELRDSYDWDNCVATGWGKDEFGKAGEYQVIMKQVQLNVVDNAQCQAKLRTVKKLGRFFKLDETALCAGGDDGQDTCKGDGGGPLVCPRKGTGAGYGGRTNSDDDYFVDHDDDDDKVDEQFVQAGIVGWGIGCGQEGLPGVYTDIASQLCYVDFARRCLHGDDAYDGIPECQNWAQDTRAGLRYALNAYQYKLSKIPETSRRYARIQKRVREHQTALDFLQDEWLFCANELKNVPYTDEGYDDQPDLDGLARRGEEDEQ